MNRIAGCALVLLLWAVPAYSQFVFSPISADLEPAGKAGFTTFTAANRTDSAIAVRVRMLTREIGEDGTERNEPETVERELAFRVLAEQLPVDFTGEDDSKTGNRASIDIRLKYLGTVYILPKNGKAQIQAGIVGRDGVQADLVLENTGTAHAILKNLRVVVSAGTDQEWAGYQLGSKDLSALAGSNMLAGGRRVAAITLPEGFPDGPARVEVYYDYP
ncbi:MAG TPA: hypothetical protein PK408_03950 [Treponemataceae bacterium]|nr:hypothetical protein [Treponemataceae bacterium]